jgi:predicted HAD superfamily hydrolase
MNIKRELSRSKKYDIISFDVFDTLIKRDCEDPKDIFLYVGELILPSSMDAFNFMTRRVNAETVAKRKSVTGEVTIDDIYMQLEKYYGELTAKLKEKEIEMEIEKCRPRNKLINLYKSFIESGKKVILISDMYLSSEVITKMLSKCGIEGHDALYVSNEWGCDKISGQLFFKVRDNLEMTNGSHLHYGDSLKADYLGAKKGGATPRFILKEHWLKKIIKKII